MLGTPLLDYVKGMVALFSGLVRARCREVIVTQRTLMLTLLVVASVPTFGQAAAPSGGEQVSAKSDQIRLILKPSRPQAASDTSFAIGAEIDNTTGRAIFVTPTSVSLAIPPEVDPAPKVGSISEWYAFFPGTGQNGENNWNKPVTVQPGSRTVAIFSLPRNPSWSERFKSAVRLVPGDYTVRVVCAYWDNFDDALQQKTNYSTQIAETTLTVIAPPAAILSGAALGGLMAFLLLPSLWLPVSKTFREHGLPWRIFIVCRGLAASSLLSVIVTILLSRVSESQFLVRVSIQDFWGAVAIGFIVGASGTSILQRWNLSQSRLLSQAAKSGSAEVATQSSNPGDPTASVDETKV